MLFSKPQAGWLIAGLGNPGKQYERTRHNVGWWALDELASRYKISVTRARFNALCGSGVIAGEKVLLLKPTTFMNSSGDAIAAAAKYYKLPPERIIIICDDISLKPGHLRIREKGSAGGHNGLRSIISCLNSEDFIRIKVGIGDRPSRDSDLADWVLAAPSSADRELIDPKIKAAADAVELIVKGDFTLAQSRLNG